jgi:hypothetical protein
MEEKKLNKLIVSPIESRIVESKIIFKNEEK